MRKYLLLAFCIMFAMSPFAKVNAEIAIGTVEVDSSMCYKSRFLNINTPIHNLQYRVECRLDTPCPDGVCGYMFVLVRDTTRGRYISMAAKKYIKHLKREMRLKYTLYDYGYDTFGRFGQLVGTKVTVYVDFFPFDRTRTVVSAKAKYYTPLREARLRAWSRKKAARETKMLKHRMGDYYYCHGQVSPERKAKVERMRKAFWDKAAMYKAQAKADDQKAWEEWKNNDKEK